MRRTCTLTASVIAAVTLTVPAPASAAKSRHMCELAAPIRASIVNKHGERAPGRDICRHGVRRRRGPGTYKPSNKQKARYLRALKRLNSPPPSLTRTGPPPQPPAGTSSPRAGGTLEAIAACESGGGYSTNTGNGYYGAYQFDLQTWQSVGGSGLPSSASPAEQDMRAAILYARRGAAPWPTCGR